MGFSEEEIEQQRRAAIGRKKNVDYDTLQAKRDLIFAARTDTPEVFQARMIARGIDLTSDQGRRIMEAYWTIRRELQR